MYVIRHRPLFSSDLIHAETQQNLQFSVQFYTGSKAIQNSEDYSTFWDKTFVYLLHKPLIHYISLAIY